jgi:signal transduction histidine kinase
LRQVFFLLLLNSADAFRERSRSGRERKITLRVDRSDSSMLTLTYTDTAGGINPGKVRSDDPRLAGLALERLIFEKGVTTKKTGTGLGLWIARILMNRHYGSIELRDYRNGVTFILRIPRSLADRVNVGRV